MINKNTRTIYKPHTIRLLSLMLGIMAFGLAFVLIINAFRNGHATAWKLLIINVFAQSFFDLIAQSLNEWS